MEGAGKYDDLATVVREKAKASGVLLIILDGEKGNGFSAQLSPDAMLVVPGMLRQVADQLEKDTNRILFSSSGQTRQTH